MDGYYAHSLEGNPDRSAWQPLEKHLRQTAELAREFASEMNAGEWGYLAGLWHDIGKYSSEFQNKISSAGGENAHIESSGRVDHSTAGAQHANRTLKDKGFGKALAYVIAGHHGGLGD
jgi:CRISPR-associated endonuclease/helicase Cas3